MISSSWKREGGTITMEITVPANASAAMWVPLEAGEMVSNGGDEPGETLLRRTSEGVMYRMASGSYRFVLKEM